MEQLPLFILGGVVVVLILMGLLFLKIFRPWLRAFLSGANVSMMQVAGMKLRGDPVDMLIDALISLRMDGYKEMRLVDVERSYAANKHRIPDVQTLLDIVYEEYGLPEG